MWWLLPALAADVAPAPRPPNVLVVVLDDVGTDKVSSYAEVPNPPATPRIDALARQGVRFRNAYAYPVCSPTRAAILTGRYARRDGMGAIVRWNGRWELPLSEVLIPEVLDGAGGIDWSTAAIGKWHLSGPNTPSAYDHPNRQGFDHYAGSLHNLYFGEDDETEGKVPGMDYFHWEKVEDGSRREVTTYATATTTGDALERVASMPQPWFLYVAYNAAHSPFHVPPGAVVGDGAPIPQLYGAMMEDLDREVGRLVDGLPAGQREHTLIVVVGDNGTPGQAVLPPRDPRKAKGTLFEGGTNVPLIVVGPGVFGGGTTDALVHVVDLLPTIAEWAGVDPKRTGRPLDGVSFAPVLRDPTSAGARTTVYTERFSPPGPPPYRSESFAIRDERYKLMVGKGEQERFFDLLGRNDDGEGKDPATLQGEERVRYLRLKAELERIHREVSFED
ncbi:MAG: sulfatase-like hydrolase/transferase [Alphaproteobacteria bacterium]|nr:sulfatase-like hydrolase/transferase [Alphaproteobacteria bacterium]